MRLEFSDRLQYVNSATVYIIQPPHSLPSNNPPFIMAVDVTTGAAVLRHPLTLQPQSWTLPTDFDLSKLQRLPIAVAHNLAVNPRKLLVVPPPPSCKPHFLNDHSLRGCRVLALYSDGRLECCHGGTNDSLCMWFDFDDIVAAGNDRTYGVDSKGMLKEIKLGKTYREVGQVVIGKCLNIDVVSVIPRVEWRKRLVVDRGELYVVVRRDEKLFRVYKLITRGSGFCWDEVREFKGNKVLFMAKDYYFFMGALSEFPGREYKNCIVFSEAAFQHHVKDSKGGGKSKDDIAIFRLVDSTFAREGESSGFPKIDWSPPHWIFASSEEFCELESEPDEDEGLLSNSKDKDKEVQSDLDNQDQEQDAMDTDSDGEYHEDGIMQFDLNSQEKEGEEIHSNPNVKDGASLQDDVCPSTDTMTPSFSAAEEVVRTLLSLNSGSDATAQETSTENITMSKLKACTYSTTTTKSNHVNHSGTTEFKGFHVRSDLVSTLQKIWQKHKNIIENTTMRNGDMIARALESLAIMVQILEDNSAQSLSDCQVVYLTSTLSDLKCICFKVHWLSSYVDKAVKLQKSKHLVDSLKNLNQLCSEVKERRAALDEEEKTLREAIEKVSSLIPFNGQIKFDEPLGVGLT